MKRAAVAPVIEYLAQSRDVVQAAIDDPAFAGTIATIVDRVAAALAAGGKVLLAGNGGSAADAQHLAGELMGRFNYDRAPAAAIALTTDTSALTAIANDYGYERVFERQVRALGHKGDVLIAISTSGRSPNILRAIAAAQEIGMVAVGFTGRALRSVPARALGFDTAHSADPHHCRTRRLWLGGGAIVPARRCGAAAVHRRRLRPPGDPGRFPVPIPRHNGYNPRRALPNTGAARPSSSAPSH